MHRFKAPMRIDLKLIILMAASLFTYPIHAGEHSNIIQYRAAYIKGDSPANSFILHENETGFSELQGLFFRALSASESIEKCCSFTPKNEINLLVREPYYVGFGRENILIEEIGLIWPKGKNSQPVLVLNKAFVLRPGQDNQSFQILMAWASKRGFD